MADLNPSSAASTPREASSEIQWHPGFCGAVEFELRDNQDILEFNPDFQVSKGPLFLDLLVIKKLRNIQISNEIGRIFRTYNVCEFKGYGDSLTIDDYFKTIAYASLVKNSGTTVNQIPAAEITLSFIQNSFPREMLRLLEASGAVIVEQFPGVFYLSRGPHGEGDVLFPTQVIVTSRLERASHCSLRILTRNAEEADVRLFLNEAQSGTEKHVRQIVDAILQVSVPANFTLFEQIRRDDSMCQALFDLMKDKIEERERRVYQEGEMEGLQKGLQKGLITGSVNIYRNEMALDDQTIIEKIASKFNLSPEQARAYVLPQGV